MNDLPAKRGRPVVPADQRHSWKLVIRLTEADGAAVELAAADAGVVPAVWIRDAIRGRLRRVRRPSEDPA